MKKKKKKKKKQQENDLCAQRRPISAVASAQSDKVFAVRSVGTAAEDPMFLYADSEDSDQTER